MEGLKFDLPGTSYFLKRIFLKCFRARGTKLLKMLFSHLFPCNFYCSGRLKMEERSSTCSNVAISTIAAPFRRLRGSDRQTSSRRIGSLSVLRQCVYGSKAAAPCVGSSRLAADAGADLKAAELMTEQLNTRAVGSDAGAWMGGGKDRGVDVK